MCLKSGQQETKESPAGSEWKIEENRRDGQRFRKRDKNLINLNSSLRQSA
jgi:hypothetical protein